MSKYDVPTQMQLEYSSMLRWMGLILLIIKKDKEAEEAFKDSIEIFENFSKPGQPIPTAPMYFILDSYIGIAFNYLNVQEYEKGLKYIDMCFRYLEENFEMKDFRNLNSYLDINFLKAYFSAFNNRIDDAI